ncbi:hypothetical protein D3C72_583010 [compost metagenome]
MTLVRLRTRDVAPGGVLRQRSVVIQQKTGRPAPFEIIEPARDAAVAAAHARTRTDYVTHSLRRTKVSLVYKKTGNLRACQLLLGRRKLESTVRCLGIEVDDPLEISEQN